MEGSKEDLSSGLTLKNDEGNQGFCMAPRVENPITQPGAPSMGTPTPTPPINMGGKRRGRPRKYDGGVGSALSPMPISASIPLSGDFSGWKQPRARPYQTIKKAHKVEFESIGDRLAYFVGGNFTPHVITVNAGEDVAMKILSFSQQESRAICVLSASGSISNVTLRQPNSSGGTLTYEGRFEILSLSGSFMPTDNGIVKSRSGGMSVSLAGPDGRVLGGGLAGVLVAASPVQVVLGSFLPGHHQEQKPKKPRVEPVTPTMPAIINQVQDGGGYGGGQKINFTSPPPPPPPSQPPPQPQPQPQPQHQHPSFHPDNLPSMNSTPLTHPTHAFLSTQHHNPLDLEADNNISSPERNFNDDLDEDDDDVDDDDDHDDSPSNLEISG